MDADAKREKRQELQQQISDLTAIRQRQMEPRNKTQQENMEKAAAAKAKNQPEAVKEAK